MNRAIARALCRARGHNMTEWTFARYFNGAERRRVVEYRTCQRECYLEGYFESRVRNA